MIKQKTRRPFIMISVIAIAVWYSAAAVPADCTHAKVPYATDLAAITAFNARYVKAINTGDSAAMSALTDDDHIMLMPGRAPLVGKAANDAANAQLFARSSIAEAWNPVETVIDGDLAYQRGTFTVTMTPKTGGAPGPRLNGTFLRIYRRQADGSWRMTRDMFNTVS